MGNKNYYFVFLLFGLSCLFSLNSHAQLKVDAGNEVIVCTPDNPIEARTQLGGNPTVSGGVEPYTYTWSGKVPILYSDYIKMINASEYLNDTTKSNPTFKSMDAPGGWVTLYLKVEDAVGKVKYDSVKIIRSVYLIKMILKQPVTINKGDSVQFFGDIYFESNLLPLKYSLSPTYGLTDPTNIYGWAKPDTSTTYYLQAINTAGCVAKTYYWRINVDTTTFSNNKVINPSIQCYLAHGVLVVNLPENNNSSYQLSVTTVNGVIILTGKYRSRNLRLSNLNFKKNQVFIVSIVDENEKQTFKLIGN